MHTLRFGRWNRMGRWGGQLVGSSLVALAVAVGGLPVTVATAAQPTKAAPLPARNLVVEIRQIEEASGEAQNYSTNAPDSPLWEPQLVRVQNGAKASLRLNSAIPMQWVQSATAGNPRLAASTSSGTVSSTTVGTTSTGTTTTSATTTMGRTKADKTAGASVGYAQTWFDAGQRLTVSPRWGGGNQAVVVEIDAEQAGTDAQHGSGSGLPAQTRHGIATTVSAPLDQWVTIAVSGGTGGMGNAANAGSYSSESATQARRLLQVRVQAP